MKLVLVESPTKARKLSTYLGRDFVVRASVGHIRDLPKSKMGVDIEHNFEPEYLIPKEKAKVVRELRDLVKDANEVVIATDPDREGEAIGWHLQELLSHPETSKRKSAKAKDPVKSAVSFVRATFHEITKSAILEAIAHPTTLNMNLVDAQQARRVLDRLVGYSLSPVLWKKVRFGLSAGRVQSVALRLIVEREREILAFIPEEYWELDVLLNAKESQKGQLKKSDSYFINHKIEQVPDGMFVARVIELNGQSYEPKKETDVQPIQGVLDTAQYQVESVERKERQRVSLPPFTTSTVQQQAATRFGYTSKQTMRLAQQLYEEGLITYHRTDSVNLSSQALDMARGFIQQTYGAPFLPDQPRFFSTKTKNAQEAHEAIRPTDLNIGEAEATRLLSTQHAKLYDLIWRRFVASQMTPAVYDQTTIIVLGTKDHTKVRLRAGGSVLKFAGWMELFPNQGDMLLPPVEKDQPLQFVEADSAQKFTQPPPRYNDASLIKVLEKEGIGRPSTYASIISVIEERGYVERQDKKFVPSAIGIAVNDFLFEHFAKIVDYQFTAKMEDDLDAVSRGEQAWRTLIGDFYTPFAKNVEKVIETAPRSQVPVEKTGETCPKCGATDHGEVVIRTGRFGKFRSCSRFPECDYTEAIVHKLEGVVCPLCHEGDVIMKPTRYGREFFGCSRYPKCDWASWQKPTPGMTVTPEEWAVQQAERAERKAASRQRRDAATFKPKIKSKPKKRKPSTKKSS